MLLANHMALVSDRVRAEMVEAMEFPEMAIKYQVQGVPRTVINETIFIEGAVPEPMFVQEVWKQLKGD